MRPLRALYHALAICHTAQARLSRSRSRVHHSTIHHATMHHPITAGHTQHTSKALEALHKQREKKQAEAEAARRNATAANEPPPQAPKPAPRKPPPPRLSPTVVARAEATSCWLHVSGLHHSGTGVLRMLIATDVHYDGADASKYDAVWASDRAGLTPWESFVRGTFGYSLLHRGNATADVRTGRFLATHLEPVVGGLEWVPRA